MRALPDGSGRLVGRLKVAAPPAVPDRAHQAAELNTTFVRALHLPIEGNAIRTADMTSVKTHEAALLRLDTPAEGCLEARLRLSVWAHGAGQGTLSAAKPGENLRTP